MSPDQALSCLRQPVGKSQQFASLFNNAGVRISRSPSVMTSTLSRLRASYICRRVVWYAKGAGFSSYVRTMCRSGIRSVSILHGAGLPPGLDHRLPVSEPGCLPAPQRPPFMRYRAVLSCLTVDSARYRHPASTPGRVDEEGAGGTLNH